MKISIASDLHLEFSDIDLKNVDSADVLILAGDILCAEPLYTHKSIPANLKKLGKNQKHALAFRDFIGRVSKEFPHVLVVAGNHEFYGGKWVKTLSTLREEYSHYPNIHFLEMDMKVICNTTFIGGTLWTDLNRGDPLTTFHVKEKMNDYKVIRNDDAGFSKLRPINVIERHRKTLGYFKIALDISTSKNVVVVSHMAPSFHSVGPDYKHDYIMNGAYASNLEDFILDNPKINLWVHGHIHTENDYMIGDTRIICNPRGYVGHDRASNEEEPFLLKTIEL